MLETKAITDQQFQQGFKEELEVATDTRDATAHAEFVAEMAGRSSMTPMATTRIPRA
jgi:membrane carboxypeptidase/penicillin-binding protein